MQRIISISVALMIAMMIATRADPALAAYGALAHEDTTSKYGLSSNEETQAEADDVAVKECGSDNCKIVFRFGPRECGAIATGESGTSWGSGKRLDKAGAELDAINNCQKRTKGQCKVRSSACNR
jgi:hypothetical protein